LIEYDILPTVQGARGRRRNRLAFTAAVAQASLGKESIRVKLLRTATVALLIIGSQHAARAAEWRFCIAPDNQERRIYITAPFLATVSMETMESGFHQALDRANRHHDSVQCPTGPGEQAVRAMRQHADDFNRQLGTEVVAVDWKPAAGR
jgi:hypothetical protein